MATSSIGSTPSTDLSPVRTQTLGLWDAISIIIGIVVGAGIYETAPFILSSVGSAGAALALWTLGGLLSLIGALCYAELATTYPRIGGDYVYLTRAYGRGVGFLFGWAELSCIMTGNIGMMVYIFAHYAGRLFSVPATQQYWLAAGAVIVLSGLNLLGIAVGKGAQNILTLAKVLGVGAIFLAGLLYGNAARLTEAQSLLNKPDYRLAMILILYTYGGWNDAAFVAAEQRNQRRNIPLALILGTLLVTVIYLLINVSYLLVLGFEGAAGAKEIAADVLERLAGIHGDRLMCALVLVSSLGAANGLILTGSRIYAAAGPGSSTIRHVGRGASALACADSLFDRSSCHHFVNGFGSGNPDRPRSHRSFPRALWRQSFRLESVGLPDTARLHGTSLLALLPPHWLVAFRTPLEGQRLGTAFPRAALSNRAVDFLRRMRLHVLFGNKLCRGERGLARSGRLGAGVFGFAVVRVIANDDEGRFATCGEVRAMSHLRDLCFTVLILTGFFFAPHFATAQTNPSPDQAKIKVYLPADAILHVDGAQTQATGEVRSFISPPLTRGKKYVYTFRATWKEGGKEVSTERTAHLEAGLDVIVDFREPAQSAENLETDTIEQLLKLAGLKKGELIYDPKCGDGRVLIAAAQKFGAKGIGFETESQRVTEATENVKKNGAADSVAIKLQDMAAQDFKDANVVALHLSPEGNVKLMPQLAKLPPGTRIVSNDADMKGAKPAKKVTVPAKSPNAGETKDHTLYLWIVPWEKE